MELAGVLLTAALLLYPSPPQAGTHLVHEGLLK
jgi:hypothetical protein